MLGRQFTIRVSPLEFQRLQREASARNVTLSSFARHALRDYLELKRELAETLALEEEKSNENGATPANGSTAPRIIHTLLARTEERIAATIDGQAERISRLRDDMRTLAAMLDRAYLSYLAHTPEVGSEFRNTALSSARRRHEAWLRTVEAFLMAGGGEPAGTLEAVDSEEGS
jgi:predicted transcriptional regulator